MAKTSKEIKALERLTSKLSALRKTLRGDERKQLDAMVLGAKSEVTAHAASVRGAVADGKQMAKAEGKTAGKSLAKSEVAVHAASVRGAVADAKTSSKNMAQAEAASMGKTLAKNMGAEVALHAANVRGARVDAKTASQTARVQINSKSGVYEVVVE